LDRPKPCCFTCARHQLLAHSTIKNRDHLIAPLLLLHFTSQAQLQYLICAKLGILGPASKAFLVRCIWGRSKHSAIHPQKTNLLNIHGAVVGLHNPTQVSKSVKTNPLAMTILHTASSHSYWGYSHWLRHECGRSPRPTMAHCLALLQPHLGQKYSR
jgi:hypothetical protein